MEYSIVIHVQKEKSSIKDIFCRVYVKKINTYNNYGIRVYFFVIITGKFAGSFNLAIFTVDRQIKNRSFPVDATSVSVATPEMPN